MFAIWDLKLIIDQVPTKNLLRWDRAFRDFRPRWRSSFLTRNHYNLVKTKDKWIHFVTLYSMESLQITSQSLECGQGCCSYAFMFLLNWIHLHFWLAGSNFPESLSSLVKQKGQSTEEGLTSMFPLLLAMLTLGRLPWHLQPADLTYTVKSFIES